MDLDPIILYEALALASGAYLLSDHGEIVLLDVRHEHADHLGLARYRLGSPVELSDVLKLVDSLGLLGTQPPVETATPTSAVPRFACPECGVVYKRSQGLGVHRRALHGVAGKHLLRGRKAEASATSS